MNKMIKCNSALTKHYLTLARGYVCFVGFFSSSSHDILPNGCQSLKHARIARVLPFHRKFSRIHICIIDNVSR